MAATAAAGVLAITASLLPTNSDPPRPPGPTTAPDPEPASTYASPLPRSAPVGLDIAAIGVHVRTVVRLGRRPDSHLEVPRDWGAVGWYAAGPWPGQLGTAALVGHVDSRTGPAVFFRLGELRPGDVVEVRRADGTVAKFTVYAVKLYPKAGFPTSRVYAPTGRAELRLITCGGNFDEDEHSYRGNIVAYAVLTGVRQGQPPARFTDKLSRGGPPDRPSGRAAAISGARRGAHQA